MPSLKVSFLPLVLATVLLTSALPATPDTIKKPLTPRQVMEHLEGPIFSLVLPFDTEGNVDHGAIRKMISNAMKYGVRIFNMTGGNTKYDWTSYDEIKAVTRTFVEAVGDRGISMVCTNNFWNSRLIDYLRYAEGLGADAVEVLAPKMPEEDIVEYFRTAAANTRMAISVKNVGLKDKTWRKLLEIDSVVAMKEHDIREYIFLEAKFADRLRVYSGGSIYRFLAAAPYGAKTYFDIYAIIAPWDRQGVLGGLPGREHGKMLRDVEEVRRPHHRGLQPPLLPRRPGVLRARQAPSAGSHEAVYRRADG